ncbi:hypothetical protein VFPBJ_01703 [Purpureocillium lilacinum]|uniref:Uncharacterized protein n=1 Tax=Purpureocillium lilacinum TaxID=33203 RepID=A0A179HDU0_PURLI|nr:hypothetical protein VFPBJ_01703 [Purpureocillium lilacinum]
MPPRLIPSSILGVPRRDVSDYSAWDGAWYGGYGGSCAIPALLARYDISGMVSRNYCPLELSIVSSV